MHVLLLGYSRIARRRLLPAFQTVFPGGRISVASKSAAADIRTAPFSWYSDYADALARSGADLAYVSLTNDAHAEWAERALEAGLHVVVDKPAVLDFRDAERLTELARSRQLLLAEATVFAFHPQIETLQDLLMESGNSRRQAVAVFSFPLLPATDFRNEPRLGGGAVWDLGPYAVASDRLLFPNAPIRMHAEVASRDRNGLINSFSIMFSHGELGSLVGHFGFGTEYENRLTVLSERTVVALTRAFTVPADARATVEVREANVTRTIDVPPSDAFAVFLKAVWTAISSNDARHFLEALNRDAVQLKRLRDALGER